MSVTLEVPLGPSLTEEDARAIYEQGPEAVIFALLTLAKQLAEQTAAAGGASHQTPSTPSGMKPTYQKPSAKGRGRKKPGRKAGHPGSRRKRPDRINRRKEHRAPCCPDCGGRLKRCQETRTRYTEDIPDDLEPEVTEHTIHRDWCPACKKKVEPPVPDALPKATLGNRTLALTAWLHFALGNTLSQVIDVFNFHLQLKLTEGGLVQMWHRLAEVLYPWYEEIGRQARQSAVLHADETGWRVNGKTHWLWCFANHQSTYFMIDRSRGSPALLTFFVEEFSGTLVSDFWGAYNKVSAALRQTCLPHLLRELEHTEKYKSPKKDWPEFVKRLRRLLKDAMRLWYRRKEYDPESYASRRQRLGERLQDLIDTPWQDAHPKRLVKRLRRHQNDLFTFLDHEGVPFDNNLAEREIRPAVIARKNSFGNRSDRGANTQAILMSIFRTLHNRGHQPIQVITQAVATYIQTGNLPPLPDQTTADG